MTTLDERKQRVRDAYEALGRSDGARLADLLADDVVYTVIGSTAFSGVFRGRGDVLERLFRPLVAALATPLAIEVLSLTAEDDRVVAQLQGRSKLRSGVPYDNTYCFVFRFAGTHVVEVTEYLDTALVARAFTVPADPTALLRLMDLNMCEMFREIVRVGRGGEILETPALTLCGSPHGTAFHNMTIVRDAVDADTVIALLRDFYVRRGLAFSVGVREHADGALADALRERGFMELVEVPGMALLADPGTRCEPPGLVVRRVRDDQGRRDYLEVTAEAYATFQQSREMTEDTFAALESLRAPHIQGFVGYLDGAPVAAAALYLTHGVAGIGWVGTLSAHRGHRYAEAVTWAAVREGFRRGAIFANLQASPLGRPVYERMGFITPTRYHVLVGTV